MAESKEFTLREVAEHDTKKDLWMVIHDKVYSVGEFVDEHPGGEEVLLDVAGQDATDSFEDVGHSDEARDILAKYQVGELKRLPGDSKPKSTPPSAAAAQQQPTTDAGTMLYAGFFIAALVAYGAWKYMQ